MNALIRWEIQDAIQKVLGRRCQDDGIWPDFTCPPELAEKMADATEAVFDAAVATSQYQEKEAA